MKTGLFSLKLRDALKGLIMAIGTPVLYFLQEYVPGLETLPPVAKIAISATITYLLKNFFTATNVEAAKIVNEAAKDENVSAGLAVQNLLK